jgi:two-component sensor histidine kinase
VRRRLGPEWISVVLDRNGAVLARSHDHDRFVGKSYPEFATDIAVSDRGLIRGTNFDGQHVLRAVVRSKMTGWLITASIPIAMAEAPLRRGLWQWGAVSFGAIGIALVLAWLFAKAMQLPMQRAAQAALALGRGETVLPIHSSLSEANTIVDALDTASSALTGRSAQQQLLQNELSHRVKNVLAVVQAIISRTLSDERPMHETREQLMNRLYALARAHELLMRADWQGAPINDIVTAELAPFSARIQIEGPSLTVDGKMVQTLALILHELVTNAAKHGALSDDKGTVSVIWSGAGSGENARFRFRWQEKDGPVAKTPSRKQFGTALLEAAISASAKPRFSYEPDGFVYEFEAPLSALTVGLKE